MSFVQQDTACPICFDDVEMTKNCIITECGHKFHASCLLRSVVHNNLDCPCCRFELVESPQEEEDDEDYDENEEDEDEEETMIFYGFRALFQRAEGEEVEPEIEDEIEDEDDEEREVPLNYIVDEFTNRNYNFNDLVTILLNDFLFKDHDQRSTDILTVLDDLIDSYVENNNNNVEAPAVQITTNNVIDLTSEEDDTNDTDSEASSDSVIFVPKINFNIVKRYQATSDLCGNN